MGDGRILTTALLIGVAMVAAPVAAAPITNPAALNQGDSFDSPLFDSSGVPFLLISSPTYFSLNNNSFNEGNEDDGPSFNSLLSFLNDGPSGGGPPFGPFGDGPPGLNVFGGGPNGNGPSGDPTHPSFGDHSDTISILHDDWDDEPPPAPVPAPEPATLLLVGTGIAAAARRRLRSNGTV